MAGGGIGVICALTSEAPKSSATTKSHSHKEVFRIPSGPEATSARALLRGLILVNELPQGVWPRKFAELALCPSTCQALSIYPLVVYALDCAESVTPLAHPSS